MMNLDSRRCTDFFHGQGFIVRAIQLPDPMVGLDAFDGSSLRCLSSGNFLFHLSPKFIFHVFSFAVYVGILHLLLMGFAKPAMLPGTRS